MDTISVTTKNDCVILHMPESCDGGLHVQLQNELNKCFSESVLSLVVDLSSLEYIDSTGIATLISVWQDYEGVARKMVLSNAGVTVQKLLNLTGAATVVPLYTTVEEAIAAVTEE